MEGDKRREKLLLILKEANGPVPGSDLAEKLGVSRQVIVTDITLLRAKNLDITSTNRGYMIAGGKEPSRVFKVIHSDDDVEKELTAIVDGGGIVEDVFVYHKVYGVVRAPLNLKSRRDITNYMNQIKSGKSTLLKNVTSGYHYHTVLADNTKVLDEIQETLWELGFLAKLQEYEPVSFGPNDSDDNK